MECSRCHGLMVRDRIFDLLDTEIQGAVWRCVCCGDILDPVILTNRRGQSSQCAEYKDCNVPLEWTVA